MFIVVGLLFLIFIFFCNYYIAKRLHRGITELLPKAPFWAILSPLLALSVIAILGFIRPNLPNTIKIILEVISSYWMAIFVYLFFLTALADLITLIIKLFNKDLIKKKLYKIISSVLVIVVTATTVILGAQNAAEIDHVSYQVKIKNETDISDLNIVLLSDLHLGSVGSEARLDNIVNEINSLKPDVVCFAGDFFDTDFSATRNPKKAIKTLKGIKSTYGTYACLGNHDAGKTLPQMEIFLKDASITLLAENYTVIDKRLVLAGRLDSSPIGSNKNQKRKDFNKIIAEKDKTLPTIVLDHNPKNISEYNGNADLILCGHTHKGQMFPLNLITSLIYDVDYGQYSSKSNVQAIVTSGIGYWGPPIRVGTNSEIVSIKIVSR